jgi:fumarylacetoacetate (FAA) hydrolase family protein
MSGDHDRYHGTAEVVKDGGVYLSAKEINELLEALDEAAYLLCPTDEDMQKKAGVYRVVSALEKLKEKNA